MNVALTGVFPASWVVLQWSQCGFPALCWTVLWHVRRPSVSVVWPARCWWLSATQSTVVLSRYTRWPFCTPLSTRLLLYLHPRCIYWPIELRIVINIQLHVKHCTAFRVCVSKKFCFGTVTGILCNFVMLSVILHSLYTLFSSKTRFIIVFFEWCLRFLWTFSSWWTVLLLGDLSSLGAPKIYYNLGYLVILPVSQWLSDTYNFRFVFVYLSRFSIAKFINAT